MSQGVVVPANVPAVGAASASVKRAAQSGLLMLLLGLAYYLAARLGLAFRFQNSQIGVVWPANAVLLSALLLTPRARWWMVLVVASVAHIAVMEAVVPAWRWTWQIVGNVVFVTTMAELIRRFAGLPLHFGSRRQVFAYTAIAFATAGLFAFTTPAFVRSVLRLEPMSDPRGALLRVTLSNATAMFLVAPMLVLWPQYGFRRMREVTGRRILEATVIMLSLLAVGLVAFGTGPEIARFPSLLLWIFLPLVWAAVRGGPLGVSTSLFCVGALSVLGTALQLGPFVLITDAYQVLSLQLFWVAIGPPIMLLAAVIREREEAEYALNEQRNQLAHVTRVTTAGEMSGALAHELRQPLTSILANAQAGMRLLDAGPVDATEMRAILEDITLQDQQAAGVISRLRSFLKEGKSRFEPLPVETVVHDALALSRSAVEVLNIDVQTEIPPGLPSVWGDPVQLLQVMVNLIVNGCESMSLTPAPERRLRLEAAALDAGHVELLVADSGVGLPNGPDDRVFEPFFTTKDKGLGLGLAIGRSIVTAHAGRLWAENNSSRGATFHLVLRTTGAPRTHSR